MQGARTQWPHRRRPPRSKENLFWQSIVNSTNPAMFEAYLAQFPNGVFRALAEARLAELRAPADNVPGGAVSRRADAAGSPATGFRSTGGRDAPRRPGEGDGSGITTPSESSAQILKRSTKVINSTVLSFVVEPPAATLNNVRYARFRRLISTLAMTTECQ